MRFIASVLALALFASLSFAGDQFAAIAYSQSTGSYGYGSWTVEGKSSEI